jgi:aspartokinase/homoserine dehydrogenase 1
MQVLKFGGTSVANATNIQKVIQIVQQASAKDQTVVVVSALGGVTDLLLDAGILASTGQEGFREKLTVAHHRHLETINQLMPAGQQDALKKLVNAAFSELQELCHGMYMLGEITPRSKDRLSHYGEWLSSQIITAAAQVSGLPATWLDSRDLIQTNSNYTYAEVNFSSTNQRMQEAIAATTNFPVIAPGFIARDAHGITTTLGRGGSDYTAAIFAAALDARVLEIWTDVSGMMTADPRVTSNAKIIPAISYQEAMELSHFGAKVIYPPTIVPVMHKRIPVWIKNTFAPADHGTVILPQDAVDADAHDIARGISSISKISLISLEGSGMVGIPGFSKRLFEALSNEKINVILITQSSSEHSISVAIDSSAAERARISVDAAFANEIALQKVEPLKVEDDLSIVALVGESMKNHTGVSGRMFYALGKNGVNIRAIAQGSSEKNISAVINTNDVRKAINVLHEEFFETTYKQVNVFLAGAGNVGRKLLDQIHQQQSFLLENLRLQLRVVGIANSRKMLIQEDGIELSAWSQQLSQAPAFELNAFISDILHRNLRNAVFVDTTANEAVAGVYDRLLEKSVAVVACNKVAASSAYANYMHLKACSREYNAPYLFETNVGAGLPVIGTLNDLMRSGDRIRRMDAVLSGTLNFVFNHYDGSRPFAAVVRQAQDEGYTEPDPRLDLGGTDVMRKILILAREAGQTLEMSDIVNNSFMPASCMEGSVDDFYAAMATQEAHFKALLDQAQAAGCKLKFVASYEQGKASVGLQHIDPKHDFYHLYGKDNIVLFYTDRYPDQPLVVKGAGAGAEVTASGVFADIIRAALR